MRTNEQLAIASIDESDISCVYSGALTGCRCGCKGQYRYNPAHRDAVQADHSDRLTEQDFNIALIRKVVIMIRSFKNVLAFLDEHPNKLEFGYQESQMGTLLKWISIDTNTRNYTAYLSDEASHRYVKPPEPTYIELLESAGMA